MTLDLNNPEVKAAVDALIAEAVTKATTGLATKNAEILNELKEIKAKKSELEVKVAEVETTNLTSKGQYDAALASTKAQHAKDIDALNQRIAVLTSRMTKGVSESALAHALNEAGFAPQFHEAVGAMMRGALEVMEDGEEYRAVFKVNGVATDIVSHLKEFAASDKGKHFVNAPTNQGSGGGVPPKGGAGQTANPWAKDSFNLTEQIRLNKQNPALAAQLKQAAGH